MSLRVLATMLRAEFPDVQVSVRRSKAGDGYFAHTTYDDEADRFTITIDRDIQEDFATFILAHEFAHVIAWDDTAKDDHGPAFWRAYMEAYRVYLRYCGR